MTAPRVEERFYWVTAKVGSKEPYHFAINCSPFRWWKAFRESVRLESELRTLTVKSYPGYYPTELIDFKEIPYHLYRDANECDMRDDLTWPIEAVEESIQGLKEKLAKLKSAGQPKGTPYR